MRKVHRVTGLSDDQLNIDDNPTQEFFGQPGVLASDGDLVQCHLCGRWFHGLNQHVMKKHGMSCDDYRREFGLNRGQPLVSKSFSETQRRGQTERLSQYWSTENAKNLFSATGPRPQPRKQWRLAIKAANAKPSLRELRRVAMSNPAHAAHSDSARSKNRESHNTPEYKSAARAAVFAGVYPLLKPEVQAKARASTKSEAASRKRSEKLKGKRRSDEQRAAQSARMKGRSGPRDKLGRFQKKGSEGSDE